MTKTTCSFEKNTRRGKVITIMIYFKDRLHEEQTNILLEKMGEKSVLQDIEYGSFAYIIGATYKAKDVIKSIDEHNNIDLGLLYDTFSVFNASERVMIRFALQCFNIQLITLS